MSNVQRSMPNVKGWYPCILDIRHWAFDIIVLMLMTARFTMLILTISNFCLQRGVLYSEML
jgi:hypothetical protein